ncbi:MAG: hypothetical protein HOP19_12665 [Acidobacteria bacterium]|nr:hypothetical protein [Acidobacteriota bacterium]
MDEAVLTMIDTAGIQGYVFGSNRLRENLGASYLVELATKAWVFQALDDVGTHNLPKVAGDAHDLNRRPHQALQMEDGKLCAELIYTGGGNALILFESLNAAQRFAQLLSQRVLREAPGLELVIAHSEPFRWKSDENDLPERWKELLDGRLAQKKRQRQATPTPQLGLGVTAECEATGLVAAFTSKGLEPEPRLIGREAEAKLRKSKRNKTEPSDATRRLLENLKLKDLCFDFPDELDQLGHKGGEESYIAVVHLDGNDMGQVRREFIEGAEDNRHYIERLRQFSKGIEDASDGALSAIFQRLQALLCKQPKLNQSGEEVWFITEPKPNFKKRKGVGANAAPVENEKDRDLEPSATPKEIEFARFEPDENDERPEEKRPKAYWPFRPIVFGGDDVTFVCNGQLGLSLAAVFAHEFAQQTEAKLGVKIHTGGGVCIVKAHYPFRRAYDLSESLTKDAKRELGKEKRDASALDWHISSTGLSGSLGAIRQREYQVKDGSLLMRPLWLDGARDWHTLQNFNWLIAVFNFHKQFAGRRNKLKALREAMRNGPEAVQEFLKTYELSQEKIIEALRLKNWDERQKSKFTGWIDDRCAYFDALEAMDHHFLIEEVCDERD